MPRFLHFSAILTPILILFMLTSFDAGKKTKVLVQITNIRNTEGEIGIGVYSNQQNWEDEKEHKQKSFAKNAMKDGNLTVEIFLRPGTYGIALLDDENRNGEMDFGWVLPEEGFGFSNYNHTGITRPDFDNFKFTVGKSTTTVTVDVKYM